MEFTNLMNPFSIIQRWLVLLIVAVAVFACGWLSGAKHEAVKAASFQGGVEALGKAQAKHVKVVEQQQQDNLKEANRDLLANVKAAGNVAVANYVARHHQRMCNAGAGSGPVPSASSGQQGNDAAAGEPMATDVAFVQACALDAGRLEAWQRWATLNHIPVQ